MPRKKNQTATLSGFFRFEHPLNARSGFANILRQTSDGFPVVCFVLHAIETGENAGIGSRAANLCGRPSDRAEANRRRVFAKMG